MPVQLSYPPPPDVAAPPPRQAPRRIPPPEKGRGPIWPWLAIVVLGGLAAAIYLALAQQSLVMPDAVPRIPVAAIDAGPTQTAIRVTGVTRAERFASIAPPRLAGSRSGQGRDVRGDLIQSNSTVTVKSTSSVAMSSTSSSLSESGSVTSTSDSRAAATGGNVSTSVETGSDAMGSSGLGSTSTGLAADAGAVSSGGGGGRSRGDFHMVLRKLAPAGVRVKKGDVIAEFDRQYMMTRLDDYLAAVTQAESSYRKGTADLSISLEAHRQAVRAGKGALEKARLDLKAAPVLSAIQAEKLRLAVEEAEAEYAQLASETEYLLASQKSQLLSAEIDVRKSQVELDRARDNLDKLIIRAPIDGMVVRLDVFFGGELRQAREGDEVWPGMPFVQAVDTSSMIVDATLNQVDVDRIHIGQHAIVRFDAFPGLELPARVHAIGTVAKARQFRREHVSEIPIQLRLETTEPRVIPDLSVAVDIELEST